MNTRINGIQQIEQALRTLEAYGYTTTPIWAEHNEWLSQFDDQPATDEDAVWATRAEKPSSTEQHFVNILRFPVYADDALPGDAPVGWREEKEYEPETLSASNAFEDRQFTLTPGQRDVLRSRHGLTPTQVVVLKNVTMFKNSHVIRSFVMANAEHIDPRRRKHVLSEVAISPASAFFRDAAKRDKEREEEQAAADAKRVKNGELPRGARARALQYFE